MAHGTLVEAHFAIVCCSCNPINMCSTHIIALSLTGASPLQGNYTLSGLIGMELCGKTVGIIGTGAIGACAARIWHVRPVQCCRSMWCTNV